MGAQELLGGLPLVEKLKHQPRTQMEIPLSDTRSNSDVVIHEKMGGLPLVNLATKSYESNTANPHDHLIASSFSNTAREITLSENETHMGNKISVLITQGPIETTNVINNIPCQSSPNRLPSSRHIGGNGCSGGGNSVNSRGQKPPIQIKDSKNRNAILETQYHFRRRKTSRRPPCRSIEWLEHLMLVRSIMAT